MFPACQTNAGRLGIDQANARHSTTEISKYSRRVWAKEWQENWALRVKGSCQLVMPHRKRERLGSSQQCNLMPEHKPLVCMSSGAKLISLNVLAIGTLIRWLWVLGYWVWVFRLPRHYPLFILQISAAGREFIERDFIFLFICLARKGSNSLFC